MKAERFQYRETQTVRIKLTRSSSAFATSREGRHKPRDCYLPTTLTIASMIGVLKFFSS